LQKSLGAPPHLGFGAAMLVAVVQEGCVSITINIPAKG
jgi:hypothetical protein